MHFAQIGPPRNVTVQQTDVGDEFVVTWYPPEYGLETLRVYVVRWFREPGHLLMGSAETRETYYKGNYFYLSLIHPFAPLIMRSHPLYSFILNFVFFPSFSSHSEISHGERAIQFPSIFAIHNRLSSGQQWIWHSHTAVSHQNEIDRHFCNVHHFSHASLCCRIHLCKETMLRTLSTGCRWKIAESIINATTNTNTLL